MEKWDTIKVEVLKVAKAVVAFIVPGIAVLVTLLSGSEGLGDVTTVEWFMIALAILGTPAAVYTVSNR